MPPEPPLLPLSRLYRVLGLHENASRAEIVRAGRSLHGMLARRRRHVPADSEVAQALEQEERALVDNLEYWTESLPSPLPAARSVSGARTPRIGWMLVLLGVSLGAVIAGLRISDSLARGPLPGSAPPDAATTGRLIVESRPKGGQLRIRVPDSDELLWKIPAEGVRLELEAGRYELEVAREDCPDTWSHTLVLGAGETRHFEPLLCRGEAELIVRSNLAGDRLRIDGYDYGATGAEPHVLSVGDHTFRVDKEGHAPFEGKVRLEPGQALEIRAELTPIDDGEARRGRPLPVERKPPTAPPRSDVLDAPSAGAPAPPLDLDLALPPLVKPNRLLFLEDGRGNRPRGGSTTWHDAVSRLMVTRFDRDGSGRIDRVDESEAIPCEFWQEIERDFDEGGLGLSLSRNYGFDGSEWIDGALGFAREIRSAVYARMQSCGLEP